MILVALLVAILAVTVFLAGISWLAALLFAVAVILGAEGVLRHFDDEEDAE
jgi:hypothetical protein